MHYIDSTFIHEQSVCWGCLLTGKYLSDVFDSPLLQQLLIKPLGLLRGHFGLISGEQANLVCVRPLAMGQGTEDGINIIRNVLR